MMTTNCKVIVVSIIMLVSNCMAKAQISVTCLQPTPSEFNNGSITFHGLSSRKTYLIRIDRDGEPLITVSINTNDSTVATLDSLGPGVYDNS
jgi:hypothetical protein